MAGIFFEGGVGCSLTVNAQCNPVLSDDCYALYYSTRCNVGVNPLQMNAVISELVNAINVINVGKNTPSPYDCNALDNLARVLRSIRDLGNQPELATEIQLTDRVAGYFGSESGTITVEQLLDWFMTQIAVICDLPAAEAPLPDNTVVAACVRGQEAGLRGQQLYNFGLGGYGYKWASFVSQRANDVIYTNDTGFPIQVCITTKDDAGLHVSSDGGATWVGIHGSQSDGEGLYGIIPAGHKYRYTGARFTNWTELRYYPD